MSEIEEQKLVSVKVVEYNVEKPIDLRCLEKRFRNDKQVFLRMLQQLSTYLIPNCMSRMNDAILVLEYEQMNFVAHTLKGASGYVGAAKLHYVCYYIQEAYHQDRLQEMIDRYPSLVEAVIEFNRYYARYLHKTIKSKPNSYTTLSYEFLRGRTI